MDIKYGCVHVEIAPLLEKLNNKNTYDWSNNKISFSLNSRSIDLVLDYINTWADEVSIKKEDKSLTIKLASVRNSCITLTNGLKSQSIELNNIELKGLSVLLQAAKVKIYGW